MKAPLFFSLFRAISITIVYLERAVCQLQIPISGLDMPVSPLYSDFKLLCVCVCVLFYSCSSYVGCATGLYICSIIWAAGLLVQICNVCALKLVSNVLNSLLFHLPSRAMQFYLMWVHLSWLHRHGVWPLMLMHYCTNINRLLLGFQEMH